MKLATLTSLPCIVALLWPLWASAEIYQSRDAAGNLVYSDRPLNAGSIRSDISAPPAGQPPPIGFATPLSDESGDMPDTDPEIRQARCQKIRELLARYEKSEYMMREGQDGKNVVLSDVEKDQEIASLREQEAAQCDP